jgi:molybdopterin-guanine dinucleotide biosynthesis protein A
MSDNLSLAIQAGGNSRRMGQDKALKPFLGHPLIQRMVERLAPIADEVMVTTNHPYDYAFLGRCLAADLIPNQGALGGLYTALAFALFPYVAVVACDMPFASAALIQKAVNLLSEEGMDVVVPRSREGLEPLHAVYRRATCLPIIKAAIGNDQLKVIDWFTSVRVREINSDEVAAVDPSGLTFWNVNTPQEFMEAEILAKSMDISGNNDQ